MINTYKQFFIVLALALVIVVSLLCFILHLIDKRIKRKKSDAIFVKRSQGHRANRLRKIYKFCAKFPITRGYINQITRHYEILCPGDKKEIEKKSIKFALRAWIICGAILFLLFLIKPSLYNACRAVLLIWVVNSEMTYGTVRRGFMKVYRQLDVFLSDIRHFYYGREAVDEAILGAMETAGKEIKIHASKIYEILNSENMSEEVLKYNDTSHNNFLKMFLAQCVSVIEYGDKTVHGEKLFLTNIKNLKIDINVEIIKLNKINFLFMGINAIIISPVLSLDAIRKWSVSNIPELHDFYYGKNGIILMILMYVFTIILYVMTGYLRENQVVLKKDYKYLETISNIKILKVALDNYMNKHYGKMEALRIDLKKMGENITPKQLMVKRLLFAAIAFILGISLFVNLHSINRHNILNNVDNIDKLTAAADDKQVRFMKEAVIKYVGKYKDKPIQEEEIKAFLSKNDLFKNNSTLTISISNEIAQRIKKYQDEYIKWYELLLNLLISYLAYCFPYLMIKFRKNIMKMNMNDEVIQFQSIILMLMYIDQMTIPKILEFMETFSVIFKDSIRACLNEYDSGDVEALNALKDRERFIPFQRLVDNFLMSDKIGLERAFDEIAVDRANTTEQRKLDTEINITNKGTLAKYIAYFHLVLVILVYMAIPFILESLRQFQQYNIGINNLS